MTLSTGLSALQANQAAMSVVGNNLANASTEGFKRQEVLFAEGPHRIYGQHSIGTGVTIADIRSATATTTELAVAETRSEAEGLRARLSTTQQIEALFIPGTGNLQERTEELFLGLERLTARPTETTVRSSVVRAASDVADEINRLMSELDGMTAATEAEIATVIEDINGESKSIAELNQQIVSLENAGQSPNELQNRRDQLVQDLAMLIDVDRIRASDGSETFLIGNGMFSIETGLQEMQIVRTAEGGLQVWRKGCDKPHDISGGKLAGLLAQFDSSKNEPGTVQYVKNQLTEFTLALAGKLDAMHASGIGIFGTFEQLSSTRPVQKVDANIATQETFVPIRSGSLFMSVHNPDGSTTLSQMELDPLSQSLQDVALSISETPNVSAFVDSAGQLKIHASPGYTFDFTGAVQTRPSNENIAGTSAPTVSGRFSGVTNDEWSVRFLGEGTVGVTEGLKIEVSGGNMPPRILSVGHDYEPSSQLILGQGIQLSLSSGTIAAGDSFTIDVVGQSDETGLLSALGINSLFVGDSPLTLQVNPLIESNPSLLASTLNGDPSDTSNILKMLSVRDERWLRDGTVTPGQFLADMIGQIGGDAVELARDVEALEEQTAFLQSRLESEVAVDVNEELAKMLQYQRSYQAAARYIATMDGMLQELFGIIG